MSSLLPLQGFAKAGLILILILSAARFVNTSAASIELAYDDGGAEGFWSDYYPNGMAVSFSPPASRWKITAILIYGFIIDRGGKPFIVEVRDEELNVIFRASLPVSEYFKNATLNWAKIPLPSMIVTGDFYVCVYPMLEPNGTQLWIAVDEDTASWRSFLIDCYAGRLSRCEAGSAMVRAEGEEAACFAEIIVESISAGEEGLGLVFKVVSPSNATEVKAVLQTGSAIEDCKVTLEEKSYMVTVPWTELSGLTQPAGLVLSVKALNSTITLAIGLSEKLFSKHLKLMEENRLLKTVLNSSRLEQEALRSMVENREADATVLKASLEVSEGKWLKKAEEAERLARELHATRLLTILLGVSTVLLSILLLRSKTSLARLRRDGEAG
ncbi:MAG: hypothetical protein QW542_03525 [Thermoproteota archaeon]